MADGEAVAEGNTHVNERVNPKSESSGGDSHSPQSPEAPASGSPNKLYAQVSPRLEPFGFAQDEPGGSGGRSEMGRAVGPPWTLSGGWKRRGHE